MEGSGVSNRYDAYYFAHCCGRPYQRDGAWMQFFGTIADRISQDIIAGREAGTVLDAGCAWGFLVELLRQRGVEAYGVDVSEFAIQNVHLDYRPYCWVGSISEPFPRKYDLIVCIEVLEHMPQAEAEKTVQNFCQHGTEILFSSTPFDYKEPTHFNVQPPEYWSELFARHGFFRDVDYDAAYITPWAVRYRANDESWVRRVREYERRFFLLWKENVDLRQLTLESRDQLAAQEAEIAALNSRLKEQEEVLVPRLIEMDRSVKDLSNQLRDIHASTSWRLIEKLQNMRMRLIPLGSTREYLLKRILGK